MKHSKLSVIRLNPDHQPNLPKRIYIIFLLTGKVTITANIEKPFAALHSTLHRVLTEGFTCLSVMVSRGRRDVVSGRRRRASRAGSRGRAASAAQPASGNRSGGCRPAAPCCNACRIKVTCKVCSVRANYRFSFREEFYNVRLYTTLTSLSKCLRHVDFFLRR